MSVARTRSIAAQLVVRFTLAAALLLSATVGAIYLLVVRHAINEDNAVLANKLAELIEELQRPDEPQSLAVALKTQRGNDDMAFYIRVLDQSGAVLAESPQMPINRQDFPAPTNTFRARGHHPESFMPPRDFRRDGRYYALTAATIENGERFLTVQLAQDRSEDESFRYEFGWLLLAMLLIAILASAVIALPVTRKSLQPLRELTRAVERTDEAHLTEGVLAESWPRELQSLGAAYDRMLARLNDSFRRLSQFSADLAHEMRTPIANMMGEAQVALTRPRANEEYRGVLESTIAECERLSGIVESLLFLARAETGGQRMSPRRFDGRAALEKIVGYFQPVAEEQGISLTATGAGDVFADPILFERAVTNLVDNALQYTPPGGNISLSLAANGEAVVSVRDSGAGIAAKDLPRVFDRFYRADPSRSEKGSGLGLALVKSIVELHGGQAAIESGAGTTVTLRFPMSGESAPERIVTKL